MGGSDSIDVTRNFLPAGYRLFPWDRWEYYGFILGGFLAYVHNLQEYKPKYANIHRYPIYTIGLGVGMFALQNYRKREEIRKHLVYLDYTRKHPEEFKKLESRTINGKGMKLV